MKKLVITIGLLLAWVTPAAAFNCIVVVYYDPDGDPMIDTDLVVRRASWENIRDLSRAQEMLTIFVNADNPLGNEATTTVTGQEEYALQFMPSSVAEPRKGIAFSEFSDSPKFAKKTMFRESPSVFEFVEATSIIPGQASSRAVFVGMDIGFISLPFNDPAYDDAQLRSLSVDRACPTP